MKESSSVYLRELDLLRSDIIILTNEWSDDSTFNIAKQYAEKIIRLVAGQIEKIRGSSLQLNEADPVNLRNQLKSLCELMNSGERDHFAQYLAILDFLINDETY
jgi:hypothetical protein